MLYPEGVPRGFRRPVIPLLKTRLVDGEELAWNVNAFGAVAIRCMCIFRKHDIVLIAGKRWAVKSFRCVMAILKSM